MVARFIAGLAILSVFSVAQAQVCTNPYVTVSFTEPCADSLQFKRAATNCISGLYVSAGSSAGSCQNPSALLASLVQSCSNQCVKPPPPPPVYSSTVTSKVTSYSVSENLVKVSWSHKGLDRYSCAQVTFNYVAVLDKSNPKNAAFLASNPVPDGNLVTSSKLICPTGNWVTSKDSAGNSTTTYPAGCYVDSFSSAALPNYYCMIQ